MITQNYKIDMTPGAVPLRVKVSQYDVGVRQLVFQLFNGPTALTSGSFDLSAQIVGTKPDKKGFEYSATVNATSSAIYVTVDITEQMTACAGDVVCEIRMYDNSNRISSANFILDVEQAALGADTDISETELPDIIDEARSYAAAAEDAAERAEQAAAGAVAGLELGKMTSFSDGTIVTDIDLHRAPVAGDRILFYHGTSVASPSNLTTYNDGVAVTTTIGDFSLTHPAGLTLMKCVALGENLRWQTVQDIADGGYTAGTGISINGTTITNSAPQLGDDIAYSKIDTVTSGALGYFNANADCLVMDFRTDAEPYDGGYTLRLTTTGASFKYAVLKDKAGNNYAEEIPSGSLVMCKSNVSGTGSEADPVVVTVLEIGNVEMAHDVEVLKDICITEKTVSGNPIVITDALPYPAVSVSAEIEAEQDLHGYDHPWVGGAGKNKLPTILSAIKANNTHGTWNGDSFTYMGITATVKTDSVGNITGFSCNGTSSNVFYFNIGLYGFVSGTDVCMSGGKNADKYLVVQGLPTLRDTGSGLVINTVNESKWIQLVILSGQTCSNEVFYPQIEIGSSKTSYAPWENICPISGHTSVTITDVDAESQTATVTVQLGQTVYDGDADITEGEGSSRTGKYTLNGTEGVNWSLINTEPTRQVIYANIQGVLTNPKTTGRKQAGGKFSCFYYAENYAVGVAFIDANNGVWLNMTFEPNKFADSAAFKTWLASNNIEFTYELATPQTIQLTPTQLTMLKGYNRLSCDGGGDITLTYKADRLAAIESTLAEITAQLAET